MKIKETDLGKPVDDNPKKMISLSIDSDVIDAIDMAVAKMKINKISDAPKSRSQWIVRAIKNQLDKEKEDDR